jgi:hypothetical protein
MIRGLTAFALLFGAIANANAAQWAYIANSPDGTAFYDTSSLSTNGSTVRVWMKLIWNKPIDNPPGKPVAYKLSRWAVNCAEHSVSVGQTVAYATDNSNVMTLPGTPNTFQEIVPESAGDILAGFVCKN